jgi:hypothetical protein
MRLRVALALVVLLAVSVGLYAVTVETHHTLLSGHVPRLIVHDDESVANTQVVVTSTAQTYSRYLREISVVCSASTTITVTVVATRSKAAGGTVDVDLPDIAITTDTNAAAYWDPGLALVPLDIIVVTVPAAGAGITCYARTVESAQ